MKINKEEVGRHPGRRNKDKGMERPTCVGEINFIFVVEAKEKVWRGGKRKNNLSSNKPAFD